MSMSGANLSGFVGTPNWMAPEAIRPDSAVPLTEKCDVWSFAVCVYGNFDIMFGPFRLLLILLTLLSATVIKTLVCTVVFLLAIDHVCPVRHLRHCCEPFLYISSMPPHRAVQ